jgi:type IV pilus assembly protein PilY1
MIVAGGYDPSGDPINIAAYDPTATKGRGIFIVDVKTGEVIAQQVFDPTAPLGDPNAEMLYAIPSSPGVFDLDFDGFADVIYVGDLGGNLWKWVIEPIGYDRVNGAGSPDDQPSWTFRKLFSAPIQTTSKGDFDHYKSFFFPPVATFKGGQLWLAFASGERANLAYEGTLDSKGDVDVGAPEDNNRFYALKDDDPLETLAISQTKADESLMLELDQSKPDICADASSYRGYYFIGEEGEKFIVNLELFLGYVFVGSFFPTDLAGGDVCSVRGQAFLSVFRIDCGEGFFDNGGDPEKKISLGAGLPTDPRVTVGNDDGSGGGNRVIINRQDGAIVNFEAPPGFSTFGMFYWREVHQ